jgi:hypothetical protein
MKAESRRWLYLITGLLAALIPVGVQLGVLDSGQGEQTNTLLVTIASLFGATGATVAARQTHRQIAEGVHDPALPAIDQLQQSANQVVAQAQEAQANMDRLREISGSLIEGTLGQVPVVGPMAGSLADQVLNQIIPR